MAGGRSERTNDLFIDDDGLGAPSEEGQVRQNSGDLVAYVGGQVRSLTSDELVKVTANDTTAGYLLAKLVAGDSTIVLTETNDGGNETLEIVANVSNIFSVDQTEAQALLTTTSTSPQDAFSGVSLAAPEDGDYLVFFDADCRVTNNSGTMGIGVGYNGINEQAGSFRAFEGKNRGSCITIKRVNGVSAADTFHGIFRKDGGSGTAQIRNRSLTIMRIA